MAQGLPVIKKIAGKKSGGFHLKIVGYGINIEN